MTELADGWLSLVSRTLRGRDPAELATTIRDGIEVQPLYTEGPPAPAAVRGAADLGRVRRGWDVRTCHRVAHGTGRSDLDVLRGRICEDLTGGATSLELQVDTGVTLDELDRVLDGVDLAQTPVALAPHADLGTAEALVALAARRGSSPADGSSLGLDPPGEWSRSGRPAGCEAAAGWAAEMLRGQGRGDDSLKTSGLGASALRVFTVDGVRYAEAGATEAQVLGWATASGIACLRALVDAGVDVDVAARLIGFRFPATADQFVTIAALRAARVMWERVVTASGGSQAAARQAQHAVTAAHIYSRRDPWVNLLRGSTAALAAGVAGADAVTVRPFDHASGAGDASGTGDASAADHASGAGDSLGRRLARNTQLLLLEESHLSKPADPAGGSFYVESLTADLARAGWSVMQSVEAAGGVAAAQAGGSLRAEIDARWNERLDALSTRREPLTGVSEYPQPEDPAASGAAAAVDGLAHGERRGLPLRRLAEPFESLRDAADRHVHATGDRPAVWLSTIGPAAAHSERTAWAQNLLAAGGIAARLGDGVESPVAAAAGFAASGLPAAVICGSDDAYRQRAASTAAALVDAGAVLVAVVCGPGTASRCEAVESGSLGEVWRQGMDVVAALTRVHSVLGIG